METRRDEGFPATNYSPENCMRIIKDFNKQLTNIFETKSSAEENAILKGFVILVRSRMQAMVEAHFAEGLEQVRSHNEPNGISSAIRDLSLTWDHIWYPIYCQFRKQRNIIAIEWARSTSKNYAEIRRFTSKVKKFSDSVSSFYMVIIQLIQKNINTNHIVPKFASDLLKLEASDEAKSDRIEKPNDKLTFIVNAAYHSSMCYLGSLNRFKAVCSRFNDKYTVEDFSLSIKYFDSATLLNPYLGRYFYQKSFIYATLNDDPKYCFNNVLAYLAPGKSAPAILKIKSVFYDKKNETQIHIRSMLKDIHQADLFSSKIVNREIIAYYTLALIGFNLNKDEWLDKDTNGKQNNIQTIMGIGIKHMEMALNERLGTRYIKNIDLIYQNLVTIIGCYHLIDDLNTVDPMNEIKQRKRTYLKFVSSYMMTVLDRVIIAGWEKSIDMYQYLAMARIMLDWIHTNEDVRKYITKNIEFMQLMATLLNKLIASKYITYEEIEPRVPIAYLLEEDVLVHTLRILLKPFNELDGRKMMESKDKCNRICGQVVESDGDGDKKLTKEEEAIVRMKSIIIMGKKLLSENINDITWNENSTQYVFTKVRRNNSNNNADKGLVNKIMNKNGSFTGGKQRGVFSKSNLRNTDSEKNKPDALEQLIKRRGVGASELPVYSGSSVVAPDSFTTKPTLGFSSNSESVKENGTDDKDVTTRSHISVNDSNASTNESEVGVTEALERDAPLDMATIESALRELTQQENDTGSTSYYENPAIEENSLPMESQPSSIPSIPANIYPNNVNQLQSMFDTTMSYSNNNVVNNGYTQPPSSGGSMYNSNFTAPLVPPGMAPSLQQNNHMGFMNELHGQTRTIPSVPPGMNLDMSHLNYPQSNNTGYMDFSRVPQSNIPVNHLQNSMVWQNGPYMPQQQPPQPQQQQQQQQHQYYPYSNMNNKPQW